MKAIFPCNGTMVIKKSDLDSLKSYYKTQLITSKLNDFAKVSKNIIQVGNFNYLPQNSNIILEPAELLSLDKLKSVLNLPPKTASTTQNNLEDDEYDESDLIDDSDLLSNPFFTTLRPLD